MLYILTTSTATHNSFQRITFTTPDEVTLQPTTVYWLYVNATGAGAGYQQTASDDEDAESQADWQIGDAKVGRTDGGAWNVPSTVACE